jgi:hypothetical protein
MYLVSIKSNSTGKWSHTSLAFAHAHAFWSSDWDVSTVEEEASVANEQKLTKVKVKVSLYLTKHHAMKTYWGSGGI